MNLIVLSILLGASTPPPASDEQREHFRDRFTIGIAGGGGVAGSAIGFGPGISIEGGVVLSDRFLVGLRLTFLTLVVATDFSGALTFDYAVSDNFALGTAVGITGLARFGLFPTFSAMLPLRLMWSPFNRRAHELARSSLVLALEAGPGIPFFPTPSAPTLAIAGQLTIGWAWW